MAVPTIDLKKLLINKEEVDEEVLCEFKKIFSSTGCCVIKNHGIPSDMFKDLLKESRRFFRLPYSIKKTYAKNSTQVNSFSGYYISKRQTFRERYDITFDMKYPSEVPKFEKIFIDYRKHCNKLTKYLLILIAKAINLEDENFFVRNHSAIFDESSQTKSHLSTIYYGRASNEHLMDKHTDISTFTLVITSSPGLQIYLNHEWVNVDCDHDGIVFHAGDLLEKWSGGLCSATVHRVFNFSTSGDDRISIPYFVHPNCNAIVKPFYNRDKYESVIAEEYWQSKFN